MNDVYFSKYRFDKHVEQYLKGPFQGTHHIYACLSFSPSFSIERLMGLMYLISVFVLLACFSTNINTICKRPCLAPLPILFFYVLTSARSM